MKAIKEKLTAHIEFLKQQISWAKEGYPYKCESGNASAEATMMHLGMEIKFLEKIIKEITDNENNEQ